MPKFEEVYCLENENLEVASFEQLRDLNEYYNFRSIK